MPLTAKQLRAEATRLRAEAERLQAQAAKLDELAADYVPGRANVLRTNLRTRIVNSMTDTEHRLATSRGKAKDALVKAANAAEPPLTLRGLAEAVGVPVSMLSEARRGKRRIRAAVASAIESLTGFKASKSNWPGGLS